MSFSENMAKVVADQLARFVTLKRHQLAGHMANLDFWVAQARHALEVIDGYEERFRRLKSAQDRYVAEHQIQTFWPTDPDIHGPPASPRRVPHGGLREARRSVTEATYRFLVRCCNDGLIPESQLRAVCKSLEIGVETTDIRPRRA
jgi:hypothetical protein